MDDRVLDFEAVTRPVCQRGAKRGNVELYRPRCCQNSFYRTHQSVRLSLLDAPEKVGNRAEDADLARVRSRAIELSNLFAELLQEPGTVTSSSPHSDEGFA